MTQPRPSQMVTRKQLALLAILLVIAGFATNYEQFRQAGHIKAKSHSRDVEIRNQDQAICTILVALGPVTSLPPTFRAPYMRSFADADCAQF